jgi:prepilin-type N-terminal cleavage/methylation domain-containing protein
LKRAYTFFEVMLVVAALGILAALIYPRILNVFPWASQADAISRARTLNMAMNSYSASVTNAAANWSAAPNDATRYNLLQTAGFLPNMPTTLSSYQPTTGYVLSFPASVIGQVVVTNPSGATVSYN